MVDTEADNKPSNASTPATNEPTTQWERNLINRLVFAGISEQRRARRWNIFFKSLFFLYLLILLVMYLPDDWTGSGMAVTRHTALLDLQGVIADDSEASADNIIHGLRAAFKDKNTAGVILRINSPGGSPVQAGYINDEIRRLRTEYPSIPLYAVITDICASGGYYVAVAADKIYADKASLVGSIGVLMDGFGFTGTMEKLGVERRLITAGENKGFLDPFSPVKEDDVQHVQGLLGDIHRQFIDTVKRGRGKRLKENADIYNGLVWTGEQSVKLGLIDGLGSSSYVAREII
ncbi:MAG: S49 family peptidase, partial [Gammaproteobacteria bacterium]